MKAWADARMPANASGWREMARERGKEPSKEQAGINFPISVSTPRRTKSLVPTLRVGTFFVPLRGALDANRRKSFPTCSQRGRAATKKLYTMGGALWIT